MITELQKFPEPTEGQSVTRLLAEVRAKFHVGKHAARSAFQFAQWQTGNTKWSTKGGRQRVLGNNYPTLVAVMRTPSRRNANVLKTNDKELSQQ